MYAPWMQSHQSHCICKTAQKAPVDSLILFVCFKKTERWPEELLPWRSPWACSEERRLLETAGWDRREIQVRNLQLRNKTGKMLWGAHSRPTVRPQRCWKGRSGPGRTVETCCNAENHCVLETNISIRNLQGLMGRDRAVNKPFIYYFGSLIAVSFLCLRS